MFWFLYMSFLFFLQYVMYVFFFILIVCFSFFKFQGGPELDGIYVKSLLPGGAAEASGKIHNGLKLFSTNWFSDWTNTYFQIDWKSTTFIENVAEKFESKL